MIVVGLERKPCGPEEYGDYASRFKKKVEFQKEDVEMEEVQEKEAKVKEKEPGKQIGVRAAQQQEDEKTTWKHQEEA